MLSKNNTIAYIVGIFAAGVLAGGAGGYSLGRKAMFKPPRQQKMLESAVEGMKQDLQLTPEQVQQITPIMAATMAEIQSIHSSIGEKIGKAIDASHEKMEPFLSPEQRTKLRECEQKRREKYMKARNNPKDKAELNGPPPSFKVCQRARNSSDQLVPDCAPRSESLLFDFSPTR